MAVSQEQYLKNLAAAGATIGQGSAGWTQANENKAKTDAAYNASETIRANQVIKDKTSAGQDTSLQQAYLKKLGGYAAGMAQPVASVTPATEQVTQFAQPSFSFDSAGMLSQIDQQASAARDAQISQSRASVDAAVASHLASLKKAYDQAVMNGELSVREAQQAFESQKVAVNQQAYQDSQVTNLAAEDRGIGNSQQAVGLMQGDNARKEGLLNQNMTQRDKQVSDIQTRLRNIATEKDINISDATAQGEFQKAQLAGQANQQYAQNMFGFNSQNFMANQGHMFDQQNMSLQQGYTQGNMAQQQGYTQANMGLQQGYTQANMGLQHGYNQEDAATQQGYTKDNMGIQQGYTQDNMELGQKFDLEKIGVGFKNDLKKMEVGQGYDMQKIGASFANQLKAMAVQNGYDNSKLDKQIAAEGDKLTKQIQAEQSQYELAIAREGAKYNPNTPEGKIRLAQLKDAHENAIVEMHGKAIYEAQLTGIMNNPLLDKDKNGAVIPWKPSGDFSKMSAAETKRMDDKNDAYRRYLQLMGGKSDPLNPNYLKPSSATISSH